MRVSLLPVALAFGLAACHASAPLPPKAIALNEAGAAAIAAGDLTTAEARLEVALEYNPRFVEAWVNLGLVALRRGNLDVAKEDFEAARDLNPDLPSPHHALGLLYDARGMAKEAEQSYREALKVDPGFAPSRANLGRRLFARGAFDEAREQFLRLVEVAPDRLEGWLGLTEAYVRLKREAEADDALARARSRFGDVPEVVLLVGRQMLRRGACADAESVLAPLTGAKDESRRAAAWAWIAVARASRGDHEGARQAVRESLSLDRDQPIARYALSTLDAALGGAPLSAGE